MHVCLKLYSYAPRIAFEESMYEVTKFIDWDPMKEVANLTPNKVYVRERYDFDIHIHIHIDKHVFVQSLIVSA